MTHHCPLCDAECDCDEEHCDHCSTEQTIEDADREESRYIDRTNARDINRKLG